MPLWDRGFQFFLLFLPCSMQQKTIRYRLCFSFFLVFGFFGFLVFLVFYAFFARVFFSVFASVFFSVFFSVSASLTEGETQLARSSRMASSVQSYAFLLLSIEKNLELSLMPLMGFSLAFSRVRTRLQKTIHSVGGFLEASSFSGAEGVEGTECADGVEGLEGVEGLDGADGADGADFFVDRATTVR